MNDWFPMIETSVAQAAKRADIPEVPGSSDGDSWIWTWRNINEARGEVAEVTLRVRPDSLGKGVGVEIAAAGWMLYKRQASARQPYYMRYIEFESWSRERSTFEDEFTSSLMRAWQEAPSLIELLPKIERDRSELMHELRKDNLLSG